MAIPPDPASPFPADRTVLVSGAGSRRGIGRATARRLSAEGWDVAVLDCDGSGAQRTADELRAAGGRAVAFEVDVSDGEAVNQVIREVSSTMPQIVGLVNNAGISSPTPILEVTEEEWKRVFEVNVHGAFHVTRAVAPLMVENRVGRIVNISSASAQRGGGVYGRAAYSASKAALLGMARTLARELGSYGITVNSVSPGSIDTDIMGGRLTDERKLMLLRELPVGRIGTVDDVANVVNFLVSAEASYITGATYDVNGGSHIA